MADIKIAMKVDSENPIVGDLYIENGNARVTKGIMEEVSQALRTHLSLFQGEWFLDTVQGVPYFQSILGQKVGVQYVGQIFRSAILKVPGIAKLNRFDLRRAGERGITLDFSLTVKDGTIITSSQFAPFEIGVSQGAT